MRWIIISLALAAVPGISQGQFANDWVKTNQDYYKLSVAKDGLYRLTYTDLLNAGFPVGASDPRRIQIFHRGQEQAIFIQGEGDANFGTSDYIEFYGHRNDGTQDKELYDIPENQPHSYYNLFNDTTSYFLTYNLLQLGKRITNSTEINVTNIPKELYHTDEKLMVLTSQYSGGYTEFDYLQHSAFSQGEGWTGASMGQGQYVDYTFSGISNTVQAGGNPQIEVLVVGRLKGSHQVRISVGNSSSAFREVTTGSFEGYETLQLNENINWTDIGSDGTLIVRVEALTVGTAANRLSASYIRLRYPQAFNAAGQTEKVLLLNATPDGKSYIEIASPPTSARLFDITDPLNIVGIRTTTTSSINAVVPNTSAQRKLLLTSTTLTPVIKRTSFRDIDPSLASYVIISHRAFMRSGGGYSNVVQAYGEYRASEEGGGYDTLILNINQLYDQFNYGETSPLAVRHLMQYLMNTKTPEYLLIIGKGLDITYDYFRNPSAFTTYKNFVPPSGYPSTDVRFTAGLGSSTYESAVPTGRLPATNPDQVAAYLNKVKEMEALPYNALWRKNLLHLSGGIRAGEPQTFKSYMVDFQVIAEDVYLGGRVKPIAKQSTDIELINISDEINNGLNLVTFYGHSSPGTIDFDIGLVSDPALGYNNAGKYPMFLINGCNAGAFYLTATLFGEDWINTANKGALGFIADSGYGLASTLKQYSQVFYANAYGDSTLIRKGIGDIQKQTARTYMDNTAASVANIAQVQQMVLLGDPAVKLFGAPRPDYEITANNVYVESFDSDPITAQTDSFALHMIVRNFGMAKRDTLTVRVTRTFNDNSTAVYDSVFTPVLYSDTLTFIVRKDRATAAGNNSFKIELDPDNEFDELDETNNTVDYGVTIPLNATRNLYPYDYAIVHNTSVDLCFQATDMTSPSRSFLVELDTAYTFDSPFKKSFTVTGKVLALQTIALLTQDSLAYYWRTRLAEPLPGESEEWTNSSFTYINNGPEGWAQIQFPQYLKNATEGLVKNATARELEFQETVTSVYIKNFGSANPASNLNVSIRINNAEYQLTGGAGTERDPCRANTINLIAFNKVTTVPYLALPFIFNDPRSCGREPQIIGSYALADLEVASYGIADYINNITAGDSVILFTIGNAGFSSWSATVKTALGNLGISTTQINALQDGEPVVIYARKGATVGSATIFRTPNAPATQQQLEVDGTVTGRYTSGVMTSVLVGPAQEWKNLICHTAQPEASDVIRIDVWGVDLDGHETELMIEVDKTTDLQTIDAAEYPYLKLLYRTSDELNLTVTDLNKWMVLYTPVPEGLLFYNNVVSPVMLIEGEKWTGEYGFTNISDKLYPDSVVVQYEFFNKTTRTLELAYKNIKAPAPGDTTLFTVATETFDKGGYNDVDVFVNPHAVPEQYFENNEIELEDYLNVQADEYSPVLEVTIDGRVVRDGDYVSPGPLIKVRLWDENHFIFKKDTTGMNIFLKYPCATDDCAFQRINFSSEEMTWFPATASSDFRVEFTPGQLAAGTYTLRVEAKDAKGNAAGEDPYEVTFVVQYEAGVVLQAPYPNPSTNVFTFTLAVAGTSAPDYLNIQMTNAEGKVIRDILVEDGLHVGSNEISWDGKDNNGQQLPPGVYMYHLLLRENGTGIPVKVPVGSNYFKSGYGKLILIR